MLCLTHPPPKKKEMIRLPYNPIILSGLAVFDRIKIGGHPPKTKHPTLGLGTLDSYDKLWEPHGMEWKEPKAQNGKKSPTKRKWPKA